MHATVLWALLSKGKGNLKVKYSVVGSIIMVTLEPVDVSSCWTFKHKWFIIIVHPGEGGSECTENKDHVCDHHLCKTKIHYTIIVLYHFFHIHLQTRMRTAAAVAVHGGGGLPQCMLGYPPRCGPRDHPWVWAWRSHPQVWAWRPPGCGPGDLQGMLGYHLQGMLGYHLQGMLGYHLQCMLGYPPPPMDRILDTRY